MQRYAVGIEFSGIQYRGWQTQQPGVASVQETIERVLSKIADEPITLHGAGRTDAGVRNKYGTILTPMQFVQSVDGSWEQIASFLRIFQFSGLNRWMKSSMHVLKPLLVATAMLYITLHIALHFYINKSRIFIKN